MSTKTKTPKSKAVQTPVKAVEKTTVRIELLQNGKAVHFSTDLSDDLKIPAVAATLAHRVVSLFQKAKKFRINLNGFSFARKFDVKIVIGGTEATGTGVILNGSMQFGLTLQDTEKSVRNFAEFIDELVTEVMTGASKVELDTIEELIEGFKEAQPVAAN